MKTVGIIVEYNPLHNGHVYHIEQAKRASGAEAVVAVMSGNFLQRGEPAIADKWARAEMALKAGVDLVIELPVAYSCQPAEWFAFGAVSLLDAAGIVDDLCFGSESGELGWMRTLAKLLHEEPEPFRALVRRQVQTGMSYPAAYSRAVHEFAQLAEVSDTSLPLEQPNNSLGLHYLMALERLDSSIRPLTIARQRAGYHQEQIDDVSIASATAIRRFLFDQNRIEDIAPYVPATTLQILIREQQMGRAPVRWSSFTAQLMHQLLSKTEEELASIHEVTEGLEYRIKQALPQLSGTLSVESLLAQIKTKRYTRTKLQRMLLRILLNHRKALLEPEQLRRGAGYIRVLGFTETGRQLLKRMRASARLPVITRTASLTDVYLQMDIQAASLYALAYTNPTQADLFRDFYAPPLRF